jgi:hypothetical protein
MFRCWTLTLLTHLERIRCGHATGLGLFECRDQRVHFCSIIDPPVPAVLGERTQKALIFPCNFDRFGAVLRNVVALVRFEGVAGLSESVSEIQIHFFEYLLKWLGVPT